MGQKLISRHHTQPLSVVYDLLNRVGLDGPLEPSTMGEVHLAIHQIEQLEQLKLLEAGDVLINDRGFTGYIYLAAIFQRDMHFIGRCSSGSFLAAQQMFGRNQAKRSQVVWLLASSKQKALCRSLGLPLKMKVRLVSLRLPSGELEVLVTSLLDEALYPTAEFLTVYHWRWEHETFHLMLKSRLELKNFGGRTLEAVRQDLQAAVLLANLESVLSEPAQAALNEQSTPEAQPRQINRANAYHALKDQVLDLLYRNIPAASVIKKLMKLFSGSPVMVRPKRKGRKRGRMSFNRSYHFERRVKKAVF